jgi:hypothetical protein
MVVDTWLQPERSGVGMPAGTRNFFLLQRVQTGPGSHSAPYFVAYRISFQGVEPPGRDIYHSHPCSAEVNNECSCASDLPTFLQGVDRDSVDFVSLLVFR